MRYNRAILAISCILLLSLLATRVSAATYGQIVTNGTTQSTSPVYDVTAFGATPTASGSANAIAFQAALTAAAGGGRIHIPCGTFTITPATLALSVTIAASEHIDIAGDGKDCTVLSLAGSSLGGITINYAGIYSSSSVHDLSFVTDRVGMNTALTLEQNVFNMNPAYSAQTSITAVVLRGSNAYTTMTT